MCMKEEIEKILQPKNPQKEADRSLTFLYTANREFEEKWNKSSGRKHLERGQRVQSENDIPKTARFLTLEGEVRNHLVPYSSLFNTDRQIF